MKDFLKITDYGKLRANPDAQTVNNVRLEVCQECDTVDPCQDSVSAAVATGVTIDSVTIDGVTTALAGATVQSGTWVDEIQVLLESGDPQEFNIRQEWNHDGTTLTYSHIGRKVVSTITTSAGALALTRDCTVALYCEYESAQVGTIGALSDGTTAAALANNPYAYTGVPATDDAEAAQLATDIETALTAIGASYTDVTVTKNVRNSNFDITIRRERDGKFLYFGNELIVEGSCEQAFA